MSKQFLVLHTDGFWTKDLKIEMDPETVLVNIDHILAIHHEGIPMSNGGGYFISEAEHLRVCKLFGINGYTMEPTGEQTT